MISYEIKHGSSLTSQYVCCTPYVWVELYRAASCDQVVRRVRQDLGRSSETYLGCHQGHLSWISRCRRAWLPTIQRLLTCNVLHRLLRSSLFWAIMTAEVWISIWATYAMSVQIARPSKIIDDHSRTAYRRCRRKWWGCEYNTHVGLAVYRVAHGMPGTSTRGRIWGTRQSILCSRLSTECSQETHRLIPITIRPLLLMQTGSLHLCFPSHSKLTRIGRIT